MALVPVLHARVSDDGMRLAWFDQERSARRAHTRSLAGKVVEVIIRKPRSKRSTDQNAWHWGVAVPLIAAAMGHGRDEHEQVHYALIAKCFGTTHDPTTGLDVPKVRSSHLSTVEFSELMEWEVRFAAEFLDVNVPLPDDAEVA